MLNFLLALPEEVANNARYILDFWAYIGFGDPIIFLFFLAGVIYTLFVYFEIDARFAMSMTLILLFIGALSFTSPLATWVASIIVLILIFILVFILSNITI